MAAFDNGNSLAVNSYSFYIAAYYGDTPPYGFRHSLQPVLAISNLVGWTGGLGCQLEMATQLAAGTLSLSIQAGLVVTLILLSLCGFAQSRSNLVQEDWRNNEAAPCGYESTSGAVGTGA